jgi:hypothetical protein
MMNDELKTAAFHSAFRIPHFPMPSLTVGLLPLSVA